MACERSVNNLNHTKTVSNNPQIDHEVELLNLNANTTYFYKIRSFSEIVVDAAPDVYFKTAPPSGSQQAFNFWVLGDCGTANDDQRAVRDAFYNYNGNDHVDGILFLGDNAYEDGKDEEYQVSLFENAYEGRLKNTVSWSCLGNHDGEEADSDDQTGPYYDIFSFPKNGECGGVGSGTEAYYSYDYGNIHFIVLDSYDSDRDVGGSMYNWCLADLQNTTSEWIIAFWHHPPYSSGNKDSDKEDKQIEMRENFLPILEANGVDLVLAGHSHTYQRSYLINGHYGQSNSFNCKTNMVGPLGKGDGRENGDGAYQKVTTGSEMDKGAVYVVTGSAGKKNSGDLDHPVMYIGIPELGSCVLEVKGNRLDLKFIRETGAVEDYFSMLKNPSPCTDWDGDGVCMYSDPDDKDPCNPNVNSPLCMSHTIIMSDDFETGYGNWRDGGSDCALKSENANSGRYAVRLRDNSKEESSISTDKLDLSNYQEVVLEFAFMGISMEDRESYYLDFSMDGGDSYFEYKEWEAGQDFENGDMYFEQVLICDDYLSDENRFRIRCDASNDNDHIFLDDITLKAIDDNCNAGMACNDGDPCTTGTIMDANCNCIGGTIVDADGDGYCSANDPEDDNPCIPDNQTTACNPCVIILQDDFEDGFDDWRDGGSDCFLSDDNAWSGDNCVLLIDNADRASSTYTRRLDFTNFESAEVMFTYYAEDMEETEDFVFEISVNDGDDYTIVRRWEYLVDFENKTRYFDTIQISNITFGEETRFRFRCDAHSNKDYVYLDDITVKGCPVNAASSNNLTVQSHSENDLENTLEEKDLAGIQMYPNPAIRTSTIKIDVGLEDVEGTIFIYNSQGILMSQIELQPSREEVFDLDIRNFPSGLYSIYLKRPDKKFVVEKIVILND